MSFVKHLIKRIFPLILLRKIRLVSNGILNKVFYPLFFPLYTKDDQFYIRYEKCNPFLKLINPAEIPERLKTGFRLWVNPGWTHDEYIYKISEPVIIDPETGWGILKKNRALLYPSLGFSNEPHVRKPSIIKFLVRKKTVDLSKSISFRDTAEENYFHFFNDILSKFYFLKRENLIDISTPLIISPKIYNTAYFGYFLNHTSLGSYNWHEHKNGIYFRSAETLFCKSFTHRLDIYNDMLDDLKIDSANLSKSRKIYLKRSRNSLRYIENEEKILPVLIEKGYEITEPENLSFKEQIQLFSQSSDLISVHGAGLTNMMFRRGGRMNVTEIFSPYPGFFPFHYIMMSKMFGFNYHALVGEKTMNQLKGGFYLNPESLKLL
jgi:hypothetical protein